METGRKARSILRFTQTGEIGGLIGQTIADLASLAAGVLVHTGFALSYRRCFPARKAAPAGAVEATTDEQLPAAG